MRFNSLVLATVGLVACISASEVLHTIHETATNHCNRIPDVVDEDNYGIIEEIVNCNLKHSNRCVSGNTINN